MQESARVIGLLVTTAVLFGLLARTADDAEWTRLFRKKTEGLSSAADRKPGLWTRYVLRIESYHRFLGKPFDVGRLRIGLFVIAAVILAITQVLRYPLLLGLAAALLVAFWWTDARLRKKAQKARDLWTEVFLNETIPVALHALVATHRLEDAVVRMAEATRYVPLQVELVRLRQMVRAPQFVGAEEAFVHWADDLGIQEVQDLALATQEATRYAVPIEALWGDMAELLAKDVAYRRELRAHTAQHRQGAKLFYGMLVTVFLIAYPFARPYMSFGIQVGFWLVLSVMTFGLYLVIRMSETLYA